jgi:hypothetical protein
MEHIIVDEFLLARLFKYFITFKELLLSKPDVGSSKRQSYF